MPRPVTDPALLAELNAAPTATPVRSRKVTDPALLAALGSPPAADTSILGPEERELAADMPALALTREALSGELIARKAKEAIGGAEVAQALDLGRRTHGMTPEYREVHGSPGAGALQFGANVASDVVGIVGSKASLPIEAGVLLGRSAGDLAAAAVQEGAAAAYRAGLEAPADWLFGEATARALASRQERGESVLGESIARSFNRHAEFAKRVLFSAAPALYAAGDAILKGEDAGKAAWETLLAYPVASVLPGVMLGRIGLKAGGKPVVRQGEVLSTPHGDPVKLNVLGERALEPVTALAQSQRVQGMQGAKGDIVRSALESAQRTIEPGWQRLAFDVVPPERIKQQRAIGGALKAANTPSPAAVGIANAVRQHGLLDAIASDLADPSVSKASARDKLAAIEGTLPEADAVLDSPLIDPAARAEAQRLGDTLVQSGMDPALAQDVVPFVAFEGIALNRADPSFDPIGAVRETANAIAKLPQPQRAPYLAALESRAKSAAENPAFLAAADQAWSAQSGMRWLTRSDIRQRDGYLQALEKVREADRAAGKPVFDLTHPELGELRGDYTYELFNKHIDELVNTAGGKERVMAVLRGAPTGRLLANPNAPAHIHALAQWANKPDGSRRRFMAAINAASLESAQNMGVDPVVVARHYDRYLSRAFTDALQVNSDLATMLDALGQTPSLAAKMGNALRSGRHKRKLTDAEAFDRFGELVDTGKLSLDNVLASTAGHMVGLSQHLQSMASMHDALAQAGRISDTQRPGWVFTGKERAALPDKAASKDPYNFALGKLADKWVDPAVGKQLDLVREATGQAPAWLSLWRWTKTVANVPMYQSRNFLQDHTGIWAISGVSPYYGAGKRSRMAADADIARWFDNGNLSPMLAEAIEQGVVDPSGRPQMDVADPHARAHIAQIANIINQQAIKATDPGARLGAIAEAVAMVRMGKGMPKELAQAALTAAGKVRSEYGTRVAEGSSAWKAALPSPNDFMRGMHEALVETGLSRWTAQQEQSRRFYAYRVGREALGLPPEQAAILAAESAYGVERPDVWFQRMQNNWAGAALLPGFFNYGIWQAKKYGQRALNDPGLYAAYVIEQGVRALNEAQLLESDEEGKHWKSRLGAAYMRRSASPDIGLSTGKDVADALRGMGLDRMAGVMERGNAAVVFDLRDLGGYQTWLHNINTNLTGSEYVLQFSPIGGLVAQFFDPDSRDPFRFGTGVPQGTPGQAPHFKQYALGLLAAASPTWATRAVEGRSLGHQIAGSIESVQTGEAQRMYPRGPALTPIDAFGQAMGPLGISTVDGLAIADAVHRRMKGAKLDTMRKAAAERAKLQPDDPAQMAQLTEQQINALAKVKQMELGLSWAYGGMDGPEFRAGRQKIEAIRKREVQRARGEGVAGPGLSDWWRDSTIAAGVTAIQEAVQGALQEFGE